MHEHDGFLAATGQRHHRHPAVHDPRLEREMTQQPRLLAERSEPHKRLHPAGRIDRLQAVHAPDVHTARYTFSSNALTPTASSTASPSLPRERTAQKAPARCGPTGPARAEHACRPHTRAPHVPATRTARCRPGPRPRRTPPTFPRRSTRCSPHPTVCAGRGSARCPARRRRRVGHRSGRRRPAEPPTFLCDEPGPQLARGRPRMPEAEQRFAERPQFTRHEPRPPLTLRHIQRSEPARPATTVSDLAASPTPTSTWHSSDSPPRCAVTNGSSAAPRRTRSKESSTQGP